MKHQQTLLLNMYSKIKLKYFWWIMCLVFISHIYWTYIIIDPDYFISFSSHYFASISFLSLSMNHIGGVMVSVFDSSAVDYGFEPHSGQTKFYNIGIWCLSANHAVSRRKSKVCLTQNQEKLLSGHWTTITHSLLGQLNINDIKIVGPNL